MGLVYEARDGKVLRALKTMDPELVGDPDRRARFELEARIGANLRGPHLVAVTDYGIDARTNVPYLVMELLQGEELGSLVARRVRLPANEVRRILSELCEALVMAHQAGVVHRDLKPNNIFITPEDGVKVLDFGIAKVLVEWRATNSMVIGTPGWMPPEQFDARPIGAYTDIWTLGLLAFYMLTGKQYWLASNLPGPEAWAVVCKEICVDSIVPASARAAALGVPGVLSPEFDTWFARCVHRDTNARFSTAERAFRTIEPHLKIRLLKGGADTTPVPPSPTDPDAEEIRHAIMTLTERVPHAVRMLGETPVVTATPIPLLVQTPPTPVDLPVADPPVVDLAAADPSPPGPAIIAPPPPSDHRLAKRRRGARRNAALVLALAVALLAAVAARASGCARVAGGHRPVAVALLEGTRG